MNIIRYLHHGKQVFVRKSLKGKHREYCLCYSCKRFLPGEDTNCAIAQENFQLCIKHSLVLPVFECPKFSI